MFLPIFQSDDFFPRLTQRNSRIKENQADAVCSDLTLVQCVYLASSEQNCSLCVLLFLDNVPVQRDLLQNVTSALLHKHARNLDADGAVHEAAMLTLIDAAGSTIPYTVRRPKSHGATLSLSAHFTGHRPASTVHARARIRDHSAQYFWSEIDLVDSKATHCGSATLLYRFADEN